MQVLLVEDEPGYARFLREILLEADSSDVVTHAETLEDALLRLDEGRFDIVLLDLGLPDADGTEALTRVAEAAPRLPIVVLSGLSDLDVALETMRLGAQEYLVKGQSEHLLLPRAIRYATERKRLQEAATTARAEAERANAVKDEFLAMLGHELRNPLAPIVTALALMRRHEHAEIDRELSIVQRQVQHVVRLVDDLLDVARITRGKMTLKLEDVDLADIVTTSIETAAPLLEQRRHTLEVEVPRGILIHGDRARLAQVVANLLTNAAKYTDPGGKVEVRARGGGGVVELSVRDNGIGMSDELLGRVFDLFEQGARSIERSGGGLGLGLAIVRNIVNLHGGTVSATSAGAGKGSEVLVRLPLQPAQSPAPRPSAPSAEEQPRTSRRVLVVDDNADGAELLALSLEQMGHTTTTAGDGLSALELAKELKPEIVLLDIGLPVMDGYEVATRMREMFGERTPMLIAVTGYGQESDRARSKAAGFDHHLVKPIDLAMLEKVVSADLPRMPPA
jgi:signal transduction histidine kinase